MLKNKLRFPTYSTFAGETVNKTFAVFGASDAGRRAVQHLAPSQPEFYFDNNEHIIGNAIGGLLVLTPSKELLINLDCLVITSLNYFPIVYELNCESNSSLFFIVPPVEIIYGRY